MKNSTKKWAAIVLAGLGAIGMSSGAIAEVGSANTKVAKGTSEGLPEFMEGVHSIALNGLVKFDWTHRDAKVPMKEGYSTERNAHTAANARTGNREDQLVYPHGFSSGTALRCFQFAVRGGFGDDLTFRGGLSFKADGDGLKVRLAPTFLSYIGLKDPYGVAFSFGQISPSFGLDGTSSSKDTIFLEGSLESSAFDVPFGLGVMMHGHFYDSVNLDVSAFTHNADSNEPFAAFTGNSSGSPTEAGGDKTKKNDTYGITGRLTFAPIMDQDKTLHFGVSGWHQNLAESLRSNTGGGVSDLAFTKGVNPSGEANGRQNSSLISTGAFTAKRFQQWGAEAAGTYGPWNLKTEFTQRKYKRSDLYVNTAQRQLSDPTFWGWHAEASWMITGEHRAYDSEGGVFKTPVPDCSSGAWEVAARYSFLKLQDEQFDGTFDQNSATGTDAETGATNCGLYTNNGVAPTYLLNGKQYNWTLGVNWFVSQNVRVSANYVYSKAKYADARRKDENLGALALRAQFAW